MNDEPSFIDETGNKYWENSEGQQHRDGDLPAVIGPDGYYAWCQNNQWHRNNDLPARIWPDGYCQWWVDDKLIKCKNCTKKEVKEYKKPYYLQKRFKFNRFENLIE